MNAVDSFQRKLGFPFCLDVFTPLPPYLFFFLGLIFLVTLSTRIIAEPEIAEVLTLGICFPAEQETCLV